MSIVYGASVVVGYSGPRADVPDEAWENDERHLHDPNPIVGSGDIVFGVQLCANDQHDDGVATKVDANRAMPPRPSWAEHWQAGLWFIWSVS